MMTISCRPIRGRNLPSNKPPCRPIRTLRVNIVNSGTKWPPRGAARDDVNVTSLFFTDSRRSVMSVQRERGVCVCPVLRVRSSRRWNRVFRDFIKKSFIYEEQIWKKKNKQKNKRPETLLPF